MAAETRDDRSRKKTRSRTWEREVVCLANSKQEARPTPSVTKKLGEIGLGRKTIIFKNVTSSATDLLEKLYEAFPRLKYAGGFDILVQRPGPERTMLMVLEPPQGGYNVPFLREHTSLLYIRPRQDLDKVPIATMYNSYEEQKNLVQANLAASLHSAASSQETIPLASHTDSTWAFPDTLPNDFDTTLNFENGERFTQLGDITLNSINVDNTNELNDVDTTHIPGHLATSHNAASPRQETSQPSPAFGWGDELDRLFSEYQLDVVNDETNVGETSPDTGLDSAHSDAQLSNEGEYSFDEASLQHGTNLVRFDNGLTYAASGLRMNNFRGSENISADSSQSDDQLVNKTHRSFGVNVRATSSDTGIDATQFDEQSSNKEECSLNITSNELLQHGEDLVRFDNDSTFEVSGSSNQRKLQNIPAGSGPKEKNLQIIVKLLCKYLAQNAEEKSDAVNQMDSSQWEITPDVCSVEVQSRFDIYANQCQEIGKYLVEFENTGYCMASGDGTKRIRGIDRIPKASRTDTHWVTVKVYDMRFGEIGHCVLKFIGTKINTNKQEICSEDPRSSDITGPPKAMKKSSNEPIGEAVPQKKTKSKSCPIDMPILLHLCDYKAKQGDKDFYRALIKLGILADVLANRSDHFKSFAVTAREHGHSELAELIAMSSRKLSCDCLMEELTLKELVDAVKTERSLANSVYSSDSDSDSCISGYNGDCDSDEALSSDVGSDDDDVRSCIILQGRKMNFTMAELDSPEFGKCYEVFELEKEANYEILELEVEQVSSKIAGSNSATISFEEQRKRENGRLRGKLGRKMDFTMAEREQWERENEQILREIEQLLREKEQWEHEKEQWEREFERLRRKLGRLRLIVTVKCEEKEAPKYFPSKWNTVEQEAEPEVEQVSSKIAGSNSATITAAEKEANYEILEPVEQVSSNIAGSNSDTISLFIVRLRRENVRLRHENGRLRRENESLNEKKMLTFGICRCTICRKARCIYTDEQEAEPERLRRENELAVVRGNERLQRILQNERLRRKLESQRQIERKRNERLRLEMFGSVNVLGQYKSRGGRWKVMLMSVGSGCGQSLWQEYLKSMGKANRNSLTHCIEGFPDPCLDTSIFSKKCFSKVVKLISVDRCNENRNSSQMNEQIEQFVDINRDPVDELQSIGAKDVESIAFVLVIIGDELVAIKKIYVQ